MDYRWLRAGTHNAVEMRVMQGLTPRDVEIAVSILDWAKDVLATENEEVKRPHGSQVVCPFIAGSISSNSFRMFFHDEVSGQSVEQLEGILLPYIEEFRSLPPYGDGHRLRKAVIVVFPNIEQSQLAVLDVCHSRVKGRFVNAGLMIGQFHAKCKEQGIWNSRFLPSKSPWPLMAIRHMALHDIIFLRNSSEWFAAYNIRFGDRFKPNQIDDDSRPFADFYYKALAAHRG